MPRRKHQTAPEVLAGLRLRRKAAGITQTQIGEAMGWPASTVCAKERGVRGTWLHEVDKWRDALERLEA